MPGIPHTTGRISGSPDAGLQISFDIFCRVVDNYGDIGVCWRLARRLAALPACGHIRLWVDDMASFARIAPRIAPDASSQTLAGVTIARWNDAADCQPADVVVEAFACDPPAAYVQRMTARQVWINLEYLSAEPWVESCHRLPSLQANGLRKFFFFPGFTPGTGGLLREQGLLARRDAWRATPDARLNLLASLGVSPAWLERLRRGATLTYLYCYPEAPLPALLQGLANSGGDALILLPEGIWPGLLPGPVVTPTGRVQACTHPFVDQDIFDRLLWSSDLNVVRGEDSLVRAIWAAQPLIWQPYLQQDDSHLDKLSAWLALSPFSGPAHEITLAWNQDDAKTVAQLLPGLLSESGYAQWQGQTRAWSESLGHGNDLAENMVAFCAEIAQTR